MEIAFETIRANADPRQDGYQSARWFSSTLRVTPDEIVEVALPQPDEKTGAAHSLALSIRLRAKQIR